MPAQVNHGSFRQPNSDDITIWRYLSFTKFASMLTTESLFFCRSDNFPDNFEGSVPVKDSTEHQLKLLTDVIGENADKGLVDTLKKIGHMRREARKSVFINCWHANEHESAAMWDLYGAEIAIRTNYATLRDLLPDTIFLGQVTYLNFEEGRLPQDTLNIFDPFMLKRKSFEHEQEVRAIFPDFGRIWNEASSPDFNGEVKIDHEKLLTHIYVSPTAPPWIYNLTKNILERFELNSNLVQSELYGTPLY